MDDEVKQEDGDDDDPMDNESMDDTGNDDPESADIREMRNRLERLGSICVYLTVTPKNYRLEAPLHVKLRGSSTLGLLPRKVLASKERGLVVKELTWVFDTVPC